MRFGWRDPDARPDGVALHSVLRWTLAGAAVVGLHAGAIWLVLNRKEASAAGEPPAAVMMELAPLAVAPEAPPDQLPPDERMTEAQPSPMEEKSDKPAELPEEKPEPVVMEVKKPVEDVPLPPTPPPEIEAPKLPEVANAEATLTPPPPQPKAARKPPPKKMAERKKPDDRKIDRTTAPLATSNPRADRAAAPSSSSAFSPSTSPATWRSSVNAHLLRHKGGSPNGALGTAVVAFVINRSGGVLSSRLVRSSGNPVLDAKAVSTPRSASPVPAPPPDVADSALTLTVPIRYDP
ncbi:protein TonB [Bradyrhizobium sp. AZCC 1719]|uniref:energy transducer TonB family protein n=1 Tax=Bradyrhizobium sp. AZCC 1719 TaxID=3117028 RepID=UPI002FF1F311